jgi:hypothetical protein
MKKILLLLLISIGLISLVYYELQNDKATTAIAEAEKAAILDAELAAYEADLLAKLALQEKEVEMARQDSLDAFQAKLANEKAAAAASTASYQDSLLDAEFAAFEAQLAAELASQEMMAEIQAEMARQSALDAFQAKLAADKAAAAKSTAAYQAKVANDAKVDALMAELSLAKELAAFEAQLAAELASQEMMAEIQAEMARQSALDAFQAKLAADKAAAAKSTAAYQARIASEAIEAEIDKFEAQLMEELLEESTGIEITITGENHNLCRSTLGLSELNIQLYNKALLGGYLGSIGPQVENGTEFSSTRWDNYISCISSLNSEL